MVKLLPAPEVPSRTARPFHGCLLFLRLHKDINMAFWLTWGLESGSGCRGVLSSGEVAAARMGGAQGEVAETVPFTSLLKDRPLDTSCLSSCFTQAP